MIMVKYTCERCVKRLSKRKRRPKKYSDYVCVLNGQRCNT